MFIVRCASGVTRIRQRAVGIALSPRRSGELDAEAGNVVAEDLAQLVVGDLADEARAAAQRRDPRGGVRRRSAAGLHALRHPAVEPRGLVGVDQPHRTLVEIFRGEELVVGGGDHVDDRVADGEDVKAGFGHGHLSMLENYAAALAARPRPINRSD